MRECPVCTWTQRAEIFRMGYRIPDGWPLPTEIVWYICDRCRMIYGDGDFNQKLLDEYYRTKYGYGVNNPDNIKRFKADAHWINHNMIKNAMIIDFGGDGERGESIIVNTLMADRGPVNVFSVGAGGELPEVCDLIYASHVLEHIYDLPQTMRRITNALKPDGLLIVDVPDATGLLERWKMPILDFNTKHINHFTLRNLLDLGFHHGLELVHLKQYELEFAPAYQAHFKRLDVAKESLEHITHNVRTKFLGLTLGASEWNHQSVNVWGMSDIVWHLLSNVDLKVLDYIDNDPAYRGTTYRGKPVLERPTNDAPILIMAQGQRKRLIENIRKAGIINQIIEI